DLLAGRPQLCARRALDVLFIDGQPRATARLDLVLRTHAEIGDVADDPVQGVVAGRRGIGAVPFAEADLLRADTDVDVRSTVDEAARSADQRVIGELDGRIALVLALDRARQEIADAQEVRDERRRGSLIEALGIAKLLVAPEVHDGDAVRPRHPILLAVAHLD